MRTRSALAVALAAAALAAGCGTDAAKDCPTAAANAEHQDMSAACTSPAAQQVAVRVRLCETCAHTAPTCVPDLGAVATNGIVWLDMRWEICADDSSCSRQVCDQVTCQFTVPAGTYDVQTTGVGGPVQFQLDTTGGSPVCSGAI